MPEPASVVISQHDQMEQNALQQQAMERELQAAGVTQAAVNMILSFAPNGDFTSVKNFFRQAANNSPAIWGVFSRAARGNTNAILEIFTYAAGGDPNAILALYAAASDGNPYALASLQLLGLSL